MALIFKGGPHGIQVLSDRRKTKICDSCVASVIYEDIWLDTYQCGRRAGPKSITYSFEITVNYVVRVEKVKTFSDIR